IIEVVRDARGETAERLHPRALLNGRTKLLLVAGIDERAAKSRSAGDSDRADVAAQRGRATVVRTQPHRDARTRARGLLPRSPRVARDEKFLQRVSDNVAWHRKAEKTAHPRVRAEDRTVGENENRRDDRAVLEQRPLVRGEIGVRRSTLSRKHDSP